MLKKNIKMFYVEISMLEKNELVHYLKIQITLRTIFSNDSILSYKSCMISYLAFEIGFTA